MPNVGGKDFPYTKAGYSAAKKAAKKTGKRMKITYKTGGKVELYQEQLKRQYHGK